VILATGRTPPPDWLLHVLLAAAVIHAVLCIGFYRWYRHTGVGRWVLSGRHDRVRQSTAIAWSIVWSFTFFSITIDPRGWQAAGLGVLRGRQHCGGRSVRYSRFSPRQSGETRDVPTHPRGSGA
jgi:hypothetical protein